MGRKPIPSLSRGKVRMGDISSSWTLANVFRDTTLAPPTWNGEEPQPLQQSLVARATGAEAQPALVLRAAIRYVHPHVGRWKHGHGSLGPLHHTDAAVVALVQGEGGGLPRVLHA